MAVYVCNATYPGGSSSNVTEMANWIINNSFAQIGAEGECIAGSVTGKTNVAIMASYGSLTATQMVSILDLDCLSFDDWTFVEEIPEGKCGPMDNPSGDGIPNIWKYATVLSANTLWTWSDVLWSSQEDQKFAAQYVESSTVTNIHLYPVWKRSLIEPEWSTNGIILELIDEFDGLLWWGVHLPPSETNGFIRLELEY